MTFLDEHDIVLHCSDVFHWIGPKKILHDVDIRVVRGEIVSLVGETGCGKSTLLRAILGTDPPAKGEIRINTADCDGDDYRVRRSPSRECGIVYQDYSLYPFLTALENVILGPMLDQTSIPFRTFRPITWRRLRRQHIEEGKALLEKLKLADAMHQYPHQLSGGMRQRVAIAQALIMKPVVLLLDEPFGALDEATREELQHMLLSLYEENCQAKDRGQPPPYTIVIVTHELNEAILVGDRVIALSRYWNWREQNHASCPGATVVYDRMAPVVRPDEDRDFERFGRQRQEIRAAAFNPNGNRHPGEFRNFWEEIRAGKGEGVLASAGKLAGVTVPVR